LNFSIARRFVDIDSLVFLDETGAKTNMTRLYGRSPLGERCLFAAPHGHWHTTTLLSAIRSTGVMEEASIVFEGATGNRHVNGAHIGMESGPTGCIIIFLRAYTTSPSSYAVSLSFLLLFSFSL